MAQQATDHSVGIACGAQAIELAHHLGQCPLRIAEGALGIAFALLFKTALTLDDFLAIEISRERDHGFAVMMRIGQQA